MESFYIVIFVSCLIFFHVRCISDLADKTNLKEEKKVVNNTDKVIQSLQESLQQPSPPISHLPFSPSSSGLGISSSRSEILIAPRLKIKPLKPTTTRLSSSLFGIESLNPSLSQEAFQNSAFSSTSNGRSFESKVYRSSTTSNSVVAKYDFHASLSTFLTYKDTHPSATGLDLSVSANNTNVNIRQTLKPSNILYNRSSGFHSSNNSLSRDETKIIYTKNVLLPIQPSLKINYDAETSRYRVLGSTIGQISIFGSSNIANGSAINVFKLGTPLPRILQYSTPRGKEVTKLTETSLAFAVKSENANGVSLTSSPNNPIDSSSKVMSTNLSLISRHFSQQPKTLISSSFVSQVGGRSTASKDNKETPSIKAVRHLVTRSILITNFSLSSLWTSTTHQRISRSSSIARNSSVISPFITEKPSTTGDKITQNKFSTPTKVSVTNTSHATKLAKDNTTTPSIENRATTLTDITTTITIMKENVTTTKSTWVTSARSISTPPSANTTKTQPNENKTAMPTDPTNVISSFKRNTTSGTVTPNATTNATKENMSTKATWGTFVPDTTTGSTQKPAVTTTDIATVITITKRLVNSTSTTATGDVSSSSTPCKKTTPGRPTIPKNTTVTAATETVTTKTTIENLTIRTTPFKRTATKTATSAGKTDITSFPTENTTTVPETTTSAFLVTTKVDATLNRTTAISTTEKLTTILGSKTLLTSVSETTTTSAMDTTELIPATTLIPLESGLHTQTESSMFIYLVLPFTAGKTKELYILVQEYKKGHMVDNSSIWPWYEVYSNNIHRYDRYRAIRITPEKSRVRRNPKIYSFYIGTEKSCGQLLKPVCNGPLKSGASYRFQIEVHLKSGSLLYTSFSKIYKTRKSAVDPTSQPPYGPSTEVLIALSVLLILFLFVILLILIIYARRRRRSRSVCSGTSSDGLRAALMGPFHKNNGRSKYAGPDLPMERKDSIKGMTRPVSIRDFKAWVLRSISDSEFRFAEEFESMRDVGRGERHEISEIPENRGKNRYVNILAYDYTRVKLSSIDDEPGSDYINANYIHGYKQPRAYIATQGPLPGTTDDFWRMTWEQNSRIIVMVTQCMEKGRVKCYKYWPKDHATCYGDITITLVSEIQLPEWVEREFLLEYEGEERFVKHFQYVAWPDHGTPKSTTEMLDFVRTIRSKQHRNDGPLICHCSAGVGRTGTYLTIDILLNKLVVENNVDVYGVVCLMRTQRCNMVQTEEQYIFIHRVILTYLEQREKKESLLAGFSTLGGMSPLPKSHKAFKVGNSTDSVCEALLDDTEDDPLKIDILDKADLLSEFDEELSKKSSTSTSNSKT